MSNKTSINPEGLRKAVEVLRPHWQEFNQQYEHDIQEYEIFSKKDSTMFGKIIKCHLISEIYLDRYLIDKFSLTNLEDIRLSYYQKAMLLPEGNAVHIFVKPGLLTLNRLRNKFAHELDHTLTENQLGPMNSALIFSERPVSEMSPIEMVEKFTAISCNFLNPKPSKFTQLFSEAVKHMAPNIQLK